MSPALRRTILPMAVLAYTLVSVALLAALFVAFYGGDCFHDPQCIAHKRAFEDALPLLVVGAMFINNLMVTVSSALGGVGPKAPSGFVAWA